MKCESCWTWRPFEKLKEDQRFESPMIFLGLSIFIFYWLLNFFSIILSSNFFYWRFRSCFLSSRFFFTARYDVSRMFLMYWSEKLWNLLTSSLILVCNLKVLTTFELRGLFYCELFFLKGSSIMVSILGLAKSSVIFFWKCFAFRGSSLT